MSTVPMHMRRSQTHFQRTAPAAAPGGTALADVERVARERAGEEWREVYEAARDLAERLRFLPWQDRARQLDAWCWQRAQTQLSLEQITGIVNRQARFLRETPAARIFADRTSGVVAGTIFGLGEAGRISCHSAALIHLLSGEPVLQQPAVAWLAAAGSEGLATAMAQLPGFAFLFLVLYPNDSAESFMARDAFFAAMLGQ